MRCNSQKSRELRNLRVAVVKAGRLEESEKRLGAIDRKSPPFTPQKSRDGEEFAITAKDEAPSSSDDGCHDQEKRNRGLVERIERL